MFYFILSRRQLHLCVVLAFRDKNKCSINLDKQHTFILIVKNKIYVNIIIFDLFPILGVNYLHLFLMDNYQPPIYIIYHHIIIKRINLLFL